ncbi:MAG TPA: flagellar hook capping FlgD N-terminal domain-containing protein [Candidatus Acidoferrales bacterium]|nr:flagellar hook capping FlgD N-terminal domain-containing protein [Candidatus Acidoferrales bacterium]
MGSTIPISQLTTQPTPSEQMPGTQSASSSTSGGALGANAFLQLLTTEMMNQDPSDPSDPTQSVTQLAQFSQLQYTQELTSAFQGFESNFSVLQSSSLVGKTVTVENSSSSGTTSTQTGTINSIDVQNGIPYFTMVGSNGQTITDPTSGQPLLFSLAQIVGIGSGSSGTGTGGSGGAGGTGTGTGGSGGG